MRSASPRRRTGAALATTSLALLFALSGTAFAGEKSQGADHRNDRAGAGKTEVPTEVENDDDSVTPDPNPGLEGSDAHPSGKDRHEDKGTQGRSTSDPDDDGRGPDRTNGGADKPFATADGTGGIDPADQDGNNGCGNDDDFEDDNEGLCGSKRPVKTSPPVETETGGETGGTTTGGTTVLANQLQNETPAVAAVETEAPAQVLGAVVERPATGGTAVLGATVSRGAALARTGLGTGVLVLFAVGLLLFGAALLRTPRGEHFA